MPLGEHKENQTLSEWVQLVVQSIALGIALAMDAFSVSMANGLQDTTMSRKKMCMIAGTFAGFQFIMPMAGWVCVTFVKEVFVVFGRLIPWFALILLVFIGGNMLAEGIRGQEYQVESLSLRLLLIQGVATSIDALSTGFTTASYDLFRALVSSLIIAGVTFPICIAGVKLGKRFGVRLADKAQILGGVILIVIGIKICFLG